MDEYEIPGQGAPPPAAGRCSARKLAAHSLPRRPPGYGLSRGHMAVPTISARSEAAVNVRSSNPCDSRLRTSYVVNPFVATGDTR